MDYIIIAKSMLIFEGLFFGLSKRFRILLFCSEKNANVKITLNKKIEFKKQGVCVWNDNMYFNYNIEKNLLMNGSVSWRVSSEKHPIFIKMFIETLYEIGMVVVDITTSDDWFLVTIWLLMR